MNPIWFLRATRWARNPPSAKRVKLVAAVVVICLSIWGIEQLFGWPEALTPESVRAPSRLGG